MTTISYQGNVTRFGFGEPLTLFGPLQIGDQVIVTWTGIDCDCYGSSPFFYPVSAATITVNNVTINMFADGGVWNNEWLGNGDSSLIQVETNSKFLSTSDARGVFGNYSSEIFFSANEVNRVPGPEAGGGVLGLLVLGLLLAVWRKREALA